MVIISVDQTRIRQKKINTKVFVKYDILLECITTRIKVQFGIVLNKLQVIYLVTCMRKLWIDIAGEYLLKSKSISAVPYGTTARKAITLFWIAAPRKRNFWGNLVHRLLLWIRLTIFQQGKLGKAFLAIFEYLVAVGQDRHQVSVSMSNLGKLVQDLAGAVS